jgi:hypothetical protein
MKSPCDDLLVLMDRWVQRACSGEAPQSDGSANEAAGTSLNADDPSTSRKDR